MQPIIIKNKKNLARVYLLTNSNTQETGKDLIINQLTDKIKISSSGYAGFSKKKYLEEFLSYQIFDSGADSIKINKKKTDQKKVVEIIDQTIKKCKEVIPSSVTNIFVFPSYSSFIKNKMSGVSGYTPWENTILIFIDQTTPQWKKSLESTITHEYLHSITRQYHKWETLFDSIIFEGLAENFVQDILKSKLSPWSRALDIKQSKNYFNKLKKTLNSKDPAVYKSVFFKNEEYPMWAGYAIGFNIIKSFLEERSGYDWNKIVKLKPKGILKESKFQ